MTKHNTTENDGSFNIKVLSYDYKVISVEPDKLFDIDGGRIDYSRTDHLRGEIEVAYDNSPQELQTNLMKEVLGSILDQLGYEDLVEDEPFIKSLATGFTQVLKDNDDFRKLYEPGSDE